MVSSAAAGLSGPVVSYGFGRDASGFGRRAGEKRKAVRAPSSIFDGEVSFIGLARRNVQWTFREPNARRAGGQIRRAPKGYG
jgi:hypothetical protein